VLGPVRQAGQHQQWRVRVMAEDRVILSGLYYVSRTSCHVVRIAGPLRHCKLFLAGNLAALTRFGKPI